MGLAAHGHRTLQILLAVVGFTEVGVTADCPTYSPGVVSGNVANAELVEASGLAASRMNADILWSHNDSAGQPRVYAMTPSGTHRGTFTLGNASNIDWEDIAIGRGPVSGIEYIYAGDIGDNFNIRSTIRVYRVPEPVVSLTGPPATTTLAGVSTITLTYPDGPRDAETLMVDVNGDIYIVTKRVSAVGRVYRAAFPQSTSGIITLQFVSQLPWGSVNGSAGATGGDIASDGSAVIVRRLTSATPQATLWLRPPGSNLWEVFNTAGCNLSLTAEPQGEAIAFVPGTLSFYTLSEGANQPLNYFSHNQIIGDVTHDGVVNIDDLVGVITGWGACPEPCAAYCPADLDHNCSVDIDDLVNVITHWG